ncbi:hypothetical protein SGRIM119S_03443 [Streptomyces griseorubiginosus]
MLNSSITRGTSVTQLLWKATNLTRPPPCATAEATSWSAARITEKIASACRTSTCPTSVNWRPRPVRTTSGAPTASWRRRIW